MAKDIEKELALWSALSFLPKVGPAEVRFLVSQFGSPLQLLGATASNLKLYSVPEATVEAIIQWQKMGTQSDIGRKSQIQYEATKQAQAHIITLGDKRYPEQLKHIHDAPLVLYAKGCVDLLKKKQIGIVGSRKPSIAGQRVAFRFGSDLAVAGYGVTSGLALGIDAAAHQGALTSGSTIAVMATGLEKIYPKKHQALAQEIMASGVIVTDFAFGTEIRRYNFPRRNRLISGLSLGVVVVEAAIKSGSLITARSALEQNREVFSVPGSVLNPLSQGCHALIKDGALLVESAADVLGHLDQGALFATSANRANKAEPLSPRQQQVFSMIGFEPVSLEELVKVVGLEINQLMEELLMMELAGLVFCEAGNYQRTGLTLN